MAEVTNKGRVLTDVELDELEEILHKYGWIGYGGDKGVACDKNGRKLTEEEIKDIESKVVVLDSELGCKMFGDKMEELMAKDLEEKGVK